MSTILVIDADAVLVGRLGRDLRERGHEVDTAESGVEGTRLMGSKSYDLAIVGGALCDGPGAEFLQARSGEQSDVPVLFLSPSKAEATELRRRSHELGIVRVLQTPLDPRTLPLEVSFALASASDERSGTGDGVASLLRDAVSAFGAALPGRLNAMREAVARARHAAGPGALAAIRAEAHKLRGTAGAYGFGHVSADAAEIEDVLAQSNRQGTPPTEEEWARIDAALARMQAAATGPSAAGNAAPTRDPD